MSLSFSVENLVKREHQLVACSNRPGSSSTFPFLPANTSPHSLKSASVELCAHTAGKPSAEEIRGRHNRTLVPSTNAQLRQGDESRSRGAVCPSSPTKSNGQPQCTGSLCSSGPTQQTLSYFDVLLPHVQVVLTSYFIS